MSAGEMHLCFETKFAGVLVIMVLLSDFLLLRVQNEQFSEEKGYILRDTEKYTCSFRRDPNPRSMDYEENTLPMSYVTSWLMTGHKSSV